MQENVYEIASRFLSGTPSIVRMRGNPGYHGWAEALVEISRTPGLEPLAGILQALAADGLRTDAPVDRFARQEAEGVPLETYLQASQLAESLYAQKAEAAFLLALVVLTGWGVSLGEGFYDRPMGGTIYYYCWTNIPYSLALAALQNGGVEPARRLMEISYDMMTKIATRHFWHPEFIAEVQRQSALIQRIHQKREIAISNLADDLRESCRSQPESFRAEVGAMLWTLGYIPESRLFRAGRGDGYVPSRRLCNLIVRQSLESIPRDPLLQYIWLSMKDRPPFNLREHEQLFPVINTVYSSSRHLVWSWVYTPNDVYPLYVAALTGWMRGDLDQNVLENYFGLCSALASLDTDIDVDWTLINTRLSGLGYELGLEVGLDSLRGKDVEIWQSSADFFSRFRKVVNSHPEIPDAWGRMNLPFFELIERWMGEGDARSGDAGSGGAGNLERVYDTVERFRVGALVYWLRAIAPLLSQEEEEALGELFEEEKSLLRQARGAYFLTLLPLLPPSFELPDLDMDAYMARQRDPEKYSYDPDTGRREYEEIHAELVALYDRMEALAPEYARRRKSLFAGLDELQASLSTHRTS